jgi:hypothetical protein
LRKLVLTAHVVTSLGWLGAIAAFLALAITGLTSEDAVLVRGVYLAAEPVLHSSVALVLLLVATALAVYKPRGRTRRGWRKATLSVLCAGAVAGCGDSADPPPAVRATDEGATHIHGLGVNPADRSLFIATHTGLFRATEEEATARRVGDSFQDTMGFTVVGPDEFLGSGHPDADDQLPPLLGLIRSDDAGATWEPVSLLGEADFHVLRAAGEHVYGFDATQGRLMLSRDGGETWDERRPPAGVFDLALDPEDPERLVVSTERGLFSSRDGGRRWRPQDREQAGLLAWTASGITLVDGEGAVHRSRDAARWTAVGDAGGQPAALAADGQDLYLALHTNEVKVSRDGGRTWTLRARG